MILHSALMVPNLLLLPETKFWYESTSIEYIRMLDRSLDTRQFFASKTFCEKECLVANEFWRSKFGHHQSDYNILIT